MSYRQKQGTAKFIKKSGGPTSQLGKPSSSTDSSVQPQIDQLMASNLKDSAGYRLRSSDKKLAQSILDEIPLLDQKLQKTLRGIAVSRRFRNFETLVEKDPSLALKIIEERLPEMVGKVLKTPVLAASGSSGIAAGTRGDPPGTRGDPPGTRGIPRGTRGSSGSPRGSSGTPDPEPAPHKKKKPVFRTKMSPF